MPTHRYCSPILISSMMAMKGGCTPRESRAQSVASSRDTYRTARHTTYVHVAEQRQGLCRQDAGVRVGGPRAHQQAGRDLQQSGREQWHCYCQVSPGCATARVWSPDRAARRNTAVYQNQCTSCCIAPGSAPVGRQRHHWSSGGFRRAVEKQKRLWRSWCLVLRLYLWPTGQLQM